MNIFSFKKSLLSLSVLSSLIISANANSEEVDLHNHAQLHAEKALAASELFPGYASLCDLDMVFRNVNVTKKAKVTVKKEKKSNESKKVSKPSQSTQPEPMQVFDNLYFLGNSGVTAWLLGDEDGYILIDALTSNEDAEKTIIGGLKKLGIDKSKIKHLLITHAHGDHYGGFRYLEKVLDLKVTISDADWELAKRLPDHPRFGPAPKEGLVAKDGDVIEVGNTKLEVHVTPSHTLGTISPVFTVYDNGKPHRAALWGGTGFNFGVNPEQLAAYANSAYRYKNYVQSQEVDVFLSNHGRRDGALEKMKLLSKRKAGEQHPFVMGERAQDVYEVLGQCALAQYDRIVSGQYQKQLEEKK